MIMVNEKKKKNQMNQFKQKTIGVNKLNDFP